MRDNILYYLVIVVILIILSTLFNNRSINFFIYLAISTFVINMFIKNLQISFFISLLIVLFLSYTNGTFETFDNANNPDINKLAKIDDSNNDDTEFNNIEEKDLFEEDEEESNKNNEKKDEKKDGKKDENKDEGDEYVRAARAQKETFRLINTIKQLDDTINGLAPTLKEGAKIIEKFKKLNLA